MQKKDHVLNKSKVKASLRSSFIFFAVALGFASLLLVLRAIAFKNPRFADFYIKNVFSPLAAAYAWLNSLAPFSVTEILIFLGVPTILILLLLALIRLLRVKKYRMIRLLRFFFISTTVMLSLFSLFIGFHGINYARSDLADTMALDVKERPLEDLENAMREFGLAAVAVRNKLPGDTDGLIQIGSFKDLQNCSHDGWDILTEEYPALASNVRAKPKPVLFSHYWSYTQVVGMYMPVLLEANINIDQPDVNIPATIAHELAHTRAFAREDEADFLALLSCFNHPDPVWQYSGLYKAWRSLSSRLASEDSAIWAEVYEQTISEAMRAELQNERSYWQLFETPVAEVSAQVNDLYLKANRSEEGIKSYGAVVDLLLAWIETDSATQQLAKMTASK